MIASGRGIVAVAHQYVAGDTLVGRVRRQRVQTGKINQSDGVANVIGFTRFAVPGGKR